MTNPTLSIITPSYNQCEFIEQNINSVKGQSEDTDISVEHIIVDGGSDDDTIDILKEYTGEYNMKWVSEPDRGQSHAINKGLRMANGDWIGWQNSDDYYLPGAFTSFDSALESSPSSKLIYGDLLIVDVDGNPISRKYSIPPSKLSQKYWSHFTSNQSLFLHRDVFDLVGNISEDYEYNMDGHLFHRITKQNFEYTIIPDFIGAIRAHEQAKTTGPKTVRQKNEKNSIYQKTNVDILLTSSMQSLVGICVKLYHLSKMRRFDALKWNLANHR